MKNIITILFILIFYITILDAQTKKQKQNEREIDSIFITNVAEYVHCNIRSVRDDDGNTYGITRWGNIDSIMFYKSGICVSLHIAFTYFVLSEIKDDPNIKIYGVGGSVKQEYNPRGDGCGHKITLVEFYGTKYYFDVGWGVYWSKTLPKHMTEHIQYINREKYKNLKRYKDTDEDIRRLYHKM